MKIMKIKQATLMIRILLNIFVHNNQTYNTIITIFISLSFDDYYCQETNEIVYVDG